MTQKFTVHSGRNARWTIYAPAIASLIAGREPWENSTGSLHGSRFDHGTGRLSPADQERYRADWIAGPIRYVIYSYSTPIAWKVRDEWVQPDARYSNTTSRHQHTVRMVLGVLTGEIGAGA